MISSGLIAISHKNMDELKLLFLFFLMPSNYVQPSSQLFEIYLSSHNIQFILTLDGYYISITFYYIWGYNNGLNFK